MLKLGRQGEALLIGFVCALLANSHTVGAQTVLPSGWTNRDVGSPVMPGSAESSAGTFTVRGAGLDIGGTSDQFQFAYQAATGDVDIRVRVTDLQDASPGAKAGLMIRESMNATAKNAFMLLSAEQRLAFQWRPRDAHKTSQVSGVVLSAPAWIRLVRQGNVFRAYSSPTGETWTQVGSATIKMTTKTYVGLAVTSHYPNQTATGIFSNLAVGSSAPSLPSPWATSDIGNPALAGAASESSGTFTVAGSGADIWNTSDQFRFVYQAVTGDTQIVARVASLQAADTSSKAGVMIREALTGSAANASMLATSSTWISQCRLLAGDLSYQAAGSAGAPPGWVRLVREGDLFTSYQSTDGSNWILLETETIPMPATVYVGLAVTSHTSTALATSTFTNVSVSAPTSNELPTVSITAPAAGADYTAPANISISATASDVDGSVTRVDFYTGTQLVASDVASPFSATWGNVPAGTYSLTAVATDNDGATTTSLPIAVTVATSNEPPTISISIPSSGTALTAPANIVISAIAGDTDGSVTRVDFYAGTQLVGSDAASPFSVTWSNVAAGSYSLTAVATDDKGAKTTSLAVSVTVTASVPPPPLPTKVVFVPPTDYATNVTSFTVELRRAGDAATVTPVATRNLGKPAVVTGEISVNISTLVDPLPAGPYYAVVVTTGPGGSTPSSPSAAFTK